MDLSDYDSKSMRIARAVLIYGYAIHAARDADDRVAMMDAAATAHNTTFAALQSEISKFVGELKYFLHNGSSVRWSASDGAFLKVLNGTYSIKSTPIDAITKKKVRGKFKCTLCGQIEHQCGFAVHFSGTPFVDRKRSIPAYSASDFNSSDPQMLAIAYGKYADNYNAAIDSTANDRSGSGVPVPSYLGVVIPGETCLRRLFAAFSAQDFMRSVFDEIAEFSTNEFAFPYERIPQERIKALASRVQQQYDCASGSAHPPPPQSSHEIDAYWNDLLTCFSSTNEDETSELELLTRGYGRMEENINNLGECVHCDDDRDTGDSGDESDAGCDDDNPRTTRPRKRKRSAVIESDDDEPSPRRAARWGESEASRLGPFAARRRAAPTPELTAATMPTPTPTPEPTPAPTPTPEPAEAVQPTEPIDDDDMHPIIAALHTVDEFTARKLRAPPLKWLGSRRSTLIKLADMSTTLLIDGNLQLSTRLFKAIAELSDVLDNRERFCGPSDHSAAHTLDLLDSTLLVPVYNTLSLEGRVEEALIVAEAIIVCHELLG